MGVEEVETYCCLDNAGHQHYIDRISDSKRCVCVCVYICVCVSEYGCVCL